MLITRFGGWRSPISENVDHDEGTAPQDQLVVAGVGGGGRWGVEFPQGASGQGDTMRVMDEPVQNRVAKPGVADQVMPVVDGDLARDERGTATGAILDDFQKIPSFAVAQGGQSPVIQDQETRLREQLQQLAP